MGGSKGSSRGGTTIVQYEPHIHDHHTRLMNSAEVDYKNLKTKSPYKDYTDIDVDVAFFGIGYLISSFFLSMIRTESSWLV